MNRTVLKSLGALVFPLASLLFACSADQREVTVYTSLDQPLSQTVLEQFERDAGIRANAVYDTEATKTTGLVNRILAEANRPQCDVFWNNENVQTLRLVSRGVTQPYVSPNAETIPASFRDPQGHWTGFAARVRVIVVNTDRVDPVPAFAEYEDIFLDSHAADSALALPLFGTTASHVAALATAWGVDETETWLRSIQDRGAQILESNGRTCDAVARGAISFAWTDSDDFAVAQSEGYPIAAVIPSSGAILIPNTVSIIAGAPHPDEAKALVDYLLRPETERLLAQQSGRQIPLHPDVETPTDVFRLSDLRVQQIDWGAVAENFEAATAMVNRVTSGGR
jgi:iron(III) transport system substrate-binding protein